MKEWKFVLSELYGIKVGLRFFYTPCTSRMTSDVIQQQNMIFQSTFDIQKNRFHFPVRMYFN